MSVDIGQQMQQLYSQFGELEGVSIELHKELLAIRIDNQQATATIFLQGAQLSHYQKNGEQPTIWCSPHCDYQAGQPLRGGIPLCWPWFGDIKKNPAAIQQLINQPDASAHGFIRNRDWQLLKVEQPHAGLTQVELGLTLSEGEEPLWPFATQLSLTISIGEQLQLHYTVHNQSPHSVVFSNALHSYFAVSDISQVQVNGLENLNYIDCTDKRSKQRQQGPVIIDKEVDRNYSGTYSDISLVDKRWQRVITLNVQGSNSAVLWNPWQDKAKRLSQFADNAYQQMLCIETANIDADSVELAHNESHQLTLTISSSTLS